MPLPGPIIVSHQPGLPASSPRTGGVRIAGQRVADQDGVVAPRRKTAVSLVSHADLGERLPAAQSERLRESQDAGLASASWTDKAIPPVNATDACLTGHLSCCRAVTTELQCLNSDTSRRTASLITTAIYRDLFTSHPVICLFESPRGLAHSPSAWSMSSMMSSTFSMPTERRMKSGVTPVASCSSSESCWWVVVAGWMTSVLASPTLARWERSFTSVDEP